MSKKDTDKKDALGNSTAEGQEGVWQYGAKPGVLEGGDKPNWHLGHNVDNRAANGAQLDADMSKGTATSSDEKTDLDEKAAKEDEKRAKQTDAEHEKADKNNAAVAKKEGKVGSANTAPRA